MNKENKQHDLYNALDMLLQEKLLTPDTITLLSIQPPKNIVQFGESLALLKKGLINYIKEFDVMDTHTSNSFFTTSFSFMKSKQWNEGEELQFAKNMLKLIDGKNNQYIQFEGVNDSSDIQEKVMNIVHLIKDDHLKKTVEENKYVIIAMLDKNEQLSPKNKDKCIVQ